MVFEDRVLDDLRVRMLLWVKVHPNGSALKATLRIEFLTDALPSIHLCVIFEVEFWTNCLPPPGASWQGPPWAGLERARPVWAGLGWPGPACAGLAADLPFPLPLATTGRVPFQCTEVGVHCASWGWTVYSCHFHRSAPPLPPIHSLRGAREGVPNPQVDLYLV